MATWVQYAKAKRFPSVRKVFQTTASFERAVRANVFGGATWARRSSGYSDEPQGSADWQVDVEAIPGVYPMYSTGVRHA